MHMADALLSPAVGGTMWAVSAATIAYCSKKVRTEMDDHKIPLMGVLGAFIFTAQMINFTIPVTGSSGHLGGGLILAILLGPYAAFLTIASVLVVQAFFFADGGLLALGCNIFNLGFFPAFVAYPFVYTKIAGDAHSGARMSAASLSAAIIALQMGSFAVVLETVLSGISSLPFSAFLLIMQPIHLAIGAIEGIVTASVISFVYKAKPDILSNSLQSPSRDHSPLRNTILGFMTVTLLIGGVVSWFASDLPDGLEWSIAKVSGQEEPHVTRQGIHSSLAALQQQLSFLPDYSFRKPAGLKPAEKAVVPSTNQAQLTERKQIVSRFGTSVSGVAGGALTLGLLFLIGFMLKQRKRMILNR
ncbi:MAG: energy-coupling factor ABC transporter permease [Desulfuromonadaceae bacterium]|nr:energy-coupling factor ABC transporter permease [Desulfuromonadaceae bacterium]